MSYTRRAYVDLAAILASEVDETEQSEFLTEAEVHLAVETLQLVGEKIADLFEKDNPRMFDRELFMRNAKIDTTD
jgi:hypothetical protein